MRFVKFTGRGVAWRVSFFASALAVWFATGSALADRIANPVTSFAGLDKITGRIISFDVAIGESVQFGTLIVTPRMCYTKPTTETPQTTGFVDVDELPAGSNTARHLFSGWMFAASPGIHGVEHPVYDVWLTDCHGGTVVEKTAPEEDPQLDNILAGQPAPKPGQDTASKNLGQGKVRRVDQPANSGGLANGATSPLRQNLEQPANTTVTNLPSLRSEPIDTAAKPGTGGVRVPPQSQQVPQQPPQVSPNGQFAPLTGNNSAPAGNNGASFGAGAGGGAGGSGVIQSLPLVPPTNVSGSGVSGANIPPARVQQNRPSSPPQGQGLPQGQNVGQLPNNVPRPPATVPAGQ